MKLNRKQDRSILYQVCSFQADYKSKMTALTSDFAETFSTIPLESLNGIRLTLTRSKHSMNSAIFVLFDRSRNKDNHQNRSVNQSGILYSGARYVALWAFVFLAHNDTRYCRKDLQCNLHRRNALLRFLASPFVICSKYLSHLQKSWACF